MLVERPDNAFTAGFIGEINFIDGRLVRDGEGWRFAVDGSHESVDLSSTPPLAEWQGGAPARLTVRPELIRIVPAGAATGLSGVLEETIYGGGTLACVVTLTKGVKVIARVAAADRPTVGPGAPVTLVWPPGRVRVFVR